VRAYNPSQKYASATEKVAAGLMGLRENRKYSSSAAEAAPTSPSLCRG
jgi:hypothetical protein